MGAGAAEGDIDEAVTDAGGGEEAAGAVDGVEQDGVAFAALDAMGGGDEDVGEAVPAEEVLEQGALGAVGGDDGDVLRGRVVEQSGEDFEDALRGVLAGESAITGRPESLAFDWDELGLGGGALLEPLGVLEGVAGDAEAVLVEGPADDLADGGGHAGLFVEEDGGVVVTAEVKGGAAEPALADGAGGGAIDGGELVGVAGEEGVTGEGEEGERVSEADLAGFVEDDQVIGGEFAEVVDTHERAGQSHGGEAGFAEGGEHAGAEFGAEFAEGVFPGDVGVGVGGGGGVGFELVEGVEEGFAAGRQEIGAGGVGGGGEVESDALAQGAVLAGGEARVDGEESEVDGGVGVGQEEDAGVGFLDEELGEQSAEGGGFAGAGRAVEERVAETGEVECLALGGAKPGEAARVQSVAGGGVAAAFDVVVPGE